MKETGCRINVMDEDTKSMLTEISTKDSTKMENLTVKVFLHGPMEKFTMENGRTELKMAMAFGKVFQAIPTSENGWIAKPRDMVCMFGKMATSTKGNGFRI